MKTEAMATMPGISSHSTNVYAALQGWGTVEHSTGRNPWNQPNNMGTDSETEAQRSSVAWPG